MLFLSAGFLGGRTEDVAVIGVIRGPVSHWIDRTQGKCCHRLWTYTSIPVKLTSKPLICWMDQDKCYDVVCIFILFAAKCMLIT